MEKANVIQKAFYRSAAYLKRHSPTILTFVGATGVVATIIMSARATPKAMKLLEEAEVQKGEELDKLDDHSNCRCQLISLLQQLVYHL